MSIVRGSHGRLYFCGAHLQRYLACLAAVPGRTGARAVDAAAVAAAVVEARRRRRHDAGDQLAEEEHHPNAELFGRRLLVLSADGAVVQSFHLPEETYDVRSMSFRDVQTRDGTVTEAYLYCMHGAAVYVLTLVDLSYTQPASPAAGLTGPPVSSRLRSRRRNA